MLLVESVDRVTVVHIEWPAIVEDSVLTRVSDQLLHLVETLGEPQIVLSLSGCRCASSSWLSVIVAAHEEAEAAGGGLVLTGVSPELRRFIGLAGLDRMLSTYASEPEAIGSFHLESAV